MNTLQRCVEIITAQISNDVEIYESSTLNDLGMDSLDVVELIMQIEDEFLIEISDELLDSIVTVDDLVKVVESKL